MSLVLLFYDSALPETMESDVAKTLEPEVAFAISIFVLAGVSSGFACLLTIFNSRPQSGWP